MQSDLTSQINQLKKELMQACAHNAELECRLLHMESDLLSALRHCHVLEEKNKTLSKQIIELSENKVSKQQKPAAKDMQPAREPKKVAAAATISTGISHPKQEPASPEQLRIRAEDAARKARRARRAAREAAAIAAAKDTPEAHKLAEEAAQRAKKARAMAAAAAAAAGISRPESACAPSA